MEHDASEDAAEDAAPREAAPAGAGEAGAGEAGAVPSSQTETPATAESSAGAVGSMGGASTEDPWASEVLAAFERDQASDRQRAQAGPGQAGMLLARRRRMILGVGGGVIGLGWCAAQLFSSGAAAGANSYLSALENGEWGRAQLLLCELRARDTNALAIESYMQGAAFRAREARLPLRSVLSREQRVEVGYPASIGEGRYEQVVLVMVAEGGEWKACPSRELYRSIPS